MHCGKRSKQLRNIPVRVVAPLDDCSSVQSITTTKYMLLPLQKQDLENVVEKETFSNSEFFKFYTRGNLYGVSCSFVMWFGFVAKKEQTWRHLLLSRLQQSSLTAATIQCCSEQKAVKYKKKNKKSSLDAKSGHEDESTAEGRESSDGSP
ncbi:hypothetical protein F2P81_012225 [Scophthalmus maximus]|uniref:Uncharacterized protein n=1 Tax=Scophthalmus maximus TaxID=52904 RepID=A0A6A4SMR1_SCOMX|nr:hypothetical protein F2P81_012225 [Scophthalmus maximus]